MTAGRNAVSRADHCEGNRTLLNLLCSEAQVWGGPVRFCFSSWPSGPEAASVRSITRGSNKHAKQVTLKMREIVVKLPNHGNLARLRRALYDEFLVGVSGRGSARSPVGWPWAHSIALFELARLSLEKEGRSPLGEARPHRARGRQSSDAQITSEPAWIPWPRRARDGGHSFEHPDPCVGRSFSRTALRSGRPRAPSHNVS